MLRGQHCLHSNFLGRSWPLLKSDFLNLVEINKITRIFNQFTARRLRKVQSTFFGNGSKRQHFLKSIQAIGFKSSASNHTFYSN